MKYSGIYQIRNRINGIMYIGSSTNVLCRLSKHKSLLKHNQHHNQKMQNSYNIHGEKGYIFCLVEKCNVNELYKREQYYVDLCRACHLELYNSDGIVENPMRGKHLSEDTRKIISEKSKGRNQGKTFEEIYGTEIASEIKRKISDSKKGTNNPNHRSKNRVISKEEHIKRSLGSIGHKRSEESKKLYSEVKKGDNNPMRKYAELRKQHSDYMKQNNPNSKKNREARKNG